MTAWIISLAGAYLVGAIPFGLVISRLKGVDIRSLGSGNIGATNVFRSVGKGWGLATFACDFLKGLLPALLFPLIIGHSEVGGDPAAPGLLCGCAAIAGHNWSIFLRFTGGKGVATSAGVLCAVVPLAGLLGVATWVVLLVASGYVAVASMGAALAIPIAGWLLYMRHGLLLPVVLTALGLLIIYTHRTNIRRLLNGTEHRFNILKGSRAETQRR